METESILRYLLEIVQTENIGNMAKLASLSIIDILLMKQKGNEVKTLCLKSSFTTTLITMVESGLDDLSDPSDIVCVSVAMEILSQFSKLPASDIEWFICEPIVRCLLEYIDCNSRFYKYPASTKALMTDLCEGQQLMGKVKVVSMASEPLSYIHKHADYAFARVPDRIKLCKLINTETEDDVDVRNSLLQQGVFWPGEFPGEVVKDTDNVWHNILVTKVLSGGMFWAQVGDDTIKSVTEIQAQLNTTTQQYVNKSRAMVGDCVVVYGDIMGCSCYLRAQMKSYHDCCAEVFSVDFGHTLTVHDKHVYVLPEKLGVKTVKKKVSLCSIDGISPPPQSEELVYNAAAILVNLCKQSLSTGEFICHLNGMEVLFRFIQHCGKPKLQAQVLTILYNMVSISKQTCAKYGNDIVLMVLGIIKLCVEQKSVRTVCDGGETEENSLSNDEKLLMARCVMILSNVMYMQEQCRDIFYQNQGIDLTLRIVFMISKKEALFMMSIRLFKVFVRDGASADTKINSSTAIEILKELIREQNQQAPALSENIQTRSTIQQAKEVLCNSDHESVDFESISNHASRPQKHVSDVDTATKYYLGHVVDIYDDDLHEILPQRTGKNIHQLTFAKHVCGMLNNGKGGKIYFGIDENHIVFGLELTRDEKDQFRLGVDRLMNGRITPILLHSKYCIKTIPVLDPASHECVPDHYVIEICVKASRDVVYTMIGDGSCYYRFGSDTFSLSKQELRNLVAMDEESIYKDEILRLTKMKEELLHSLNTQV